MTMNEAFRPLLAKCVIIYLDDILVYSRDKQQHLADLEAVFTVLDKHILLTKGSKCEFLQDRLELLGHVIYKAGVEIDPKKLDTVKAWHPPANITELQSFLGFVNYVRRFVPNMACLTAPLTDLLRKGVAFTWGGGKEHAAFSTLKIFLCSPPVLRIADPHSPFEVVTNAHRHWSHTATGFRQRFTAHPIRVTKTASAREELPDTRLRNPCDRACLQSVALLLDWRRRVSTDRP
ncbi:unnamed protein product [Closterium sp. NIES-54]